MKKLLLILLCLSSQWIMAQKDAPKWVDKAKRAVFSIVTYDQEDKLMNTGNGFFISEDGIALSDYTLFKGAQRAVIITSEGKQMPVKNIMGVNDMYDIVKFRVDVDKKAPGTLSVATEAPEKGTEVYLLPYSTKKDRTCTIGTVKEVSPLPGGYHYYTLDIPSNEKMVSCPVTTADGQVFSMIQADVSGNKTESYAISAAFAKDLSINVLSLNNAALKSIGIKKALPDTEEQALVYLLMSASTMDSNDYLQLLNDFIEQYPNSPEGYTRRANYYVYNLKDEQHFALAEADLNTALKLTDKKDEVYYNKAKLIYANEIDQSPFKYKNWGYPEALEEAGKALAVNQLPLYQQLRGDIYFAMQDYPKAYECYSIVNQSNLVSPATYYSAAKTKELMKADETEVIALLDSAINLFSKPLPEDAGPYLFERAQHKENKEMYKEAVDDYDEYYHVVNGKVNDLFYYYREQANYKSRNFKRALEDIQKALEISPKDVTYLAELGAINLRVARYEEAIKNLQDALAIDPKFAACYRLIGFCQIQLNQKDKACENFAKAKELGDEAVESLIQKNCQ
ncbi:MULTISPECIES: tetratricopeptide repeat protein [unclassified Bacteroides]|jgi:tetratricopeptide (TPR) repeat protein|uniref:tetratricopeptide repeat protein n=1 Tax=unclassified Bacteroides TaxID=2646097 RepID=UPI000E940E3B|nr:MULTISPECIES: tetratricopeptide repeat protein [unclassified Bacteroides]RGN50677.1 serine protease [Bacteroides sp. OM05-12]RHR76501.1 serine protease [Bacteroides sp. AF16-49]